jgi:hypothetical protein
MNDAIATNAIKLFQHDHRAAMMIAVDGSPLRQSRCKAPHQQEQPRRN